MTWPIVTLICFLLMWVLEVAKRLESRSKNRVVEVDSADIIRQLQSLKEDQMAQAKYIDETKKLVSEMNLAAGLVRPRGPR